MSYPKAVGGFLPRPFFLVSGGENNFFPHSPLPHLSLVSHQSIASSQCLPLPRRFSVRRHFGATWKDFAKKLHPSGRTRPRVRDFSRKGRDFDSRSPPICQGDPAERSETSNRLGADRLRQSLPEERSGSDKGRGRDFATPGTAVPGV